MPRARLADVAARAGVSTATASLVLRDQPGPSAPTREAVRAAAEALGYRADRAASLLARRRTHLLGVVLDLASPFHTELTAALDQASTVRGYDLVLSALTPARGERRAVETLLDFRCEGLVLLGPAGAAAELRALGEQRPVVVVGRALRQRGPVNVVRAADDRGVAAVVEHLAEQGHRDIWFLGSPGSPIGAVRRRGYRLAMRRLGLADRVRIVAAGPTEQAGAQATEAVVTMPSALPTALVCFNDRCAVGVLDRLAAHGIRVPGQVSVAGYDDSALAELGTIRLTSVSQQPAIMADAAVNGLVRRIERGSSGGPGLPVGTDTVLDPRLVVRATSGRVADERGRFSFSAPG